MEKLSSVIGVLLGLLFIQGYHAAATNYPTNTTLKWYLVMDYGTPYNASLSLAPDGTLYTVNQQILSAIDTSVINTNDVNYPSQDDFTKWSANDSYWDGMGTTPAVGADGTIYASLDGSAFFAINPNNGAVLWAFRNQVEWYAELQPAVGVDGTVYIAGSGSSLEYSFLFALTNAFGVTNYYSDTNLYPYVLTNVGIKWVFVTTNGNGAFTGAPGSLGAAPAIGPDGTIYVNYSFDEGGGNQGLFALNSTNGLLRWQTSQLASGWLTTGPAVGPDGTIYFGMVTNFVAVNPNSPVTNGILGFKWIYSNTDFAFKWCPVVGSDGTVYIEANSNTNSTANTLFAFNPTTGIPKWTYNLLPINYTGGYWKSGSLAIAADGEIILADWDGTLYSFSPNGQTNWTYQTGPQALNSPLIGPDGTIYVGSIDSDIYTCYVYAFAGASPIACGSWPEDGRNARRTAAFATANLSSPNMRTNGFQFTISGVSNVPVCPCASSDLVNWTNIGQVMLTNGIANFMDNGTNNYQHRFYRAFPQ